MAKRAKELAAKGPKWVKVIHGPQLSYVSAAEKLKKLVQEKLSKYFKVMLLLDKEAIDPQPERFDVYAFPYEELAKDEYMMDKGK